MEERERLEARRWGISVSRGEEVPAAVGSGPGGGEGGWRDEVEEAMVNEEVGAWCISRQWYLTFLHARVHQLKALKPG